MPRNRLTDPGAAAVLLSGVCAGSMDSRKGRASVTPAPRRNVRRGMNFFVMSIAAPLVRGVVRRLLHPRLEGSALNDSHHQRRKLVVALLTVLNDRADHGHVVVLDPASDRKRHHLFSHHSD